jgi:hypothetical protein
MTDREERLEEALLKIKQWAEAYPVSVFLPVSDDDLKHAGELLALNGISLTGIHGAWARHILNGISEIVDQALKYEPNVE